MTTDDVEKYYKGVFDNAGVGILAINLEDRIIEANQALLIMLGYDKADLYKRSFLDITHPKKEQMFQPEKNTTTFKPPWNDTPFRN